MSWTHLCCKYCTKYETGISKDCESTKCNMTGIWWNDIHFPDRSGVYLQCHGVYTPSRNWHWKSMNVHGHSWDFMVKNMEKRSVGQCSTILGVSKKISYSQACKLPRANSTLPHFTSQLAGLYSVYSTSFWVHNSEMQFITCWQWCSCLECSLLLHDSTVKLTNASSLFIRQKTILACVHTEDLTFGCTIDIVIENSTAAILTRSISDPDVYIIVRYSIRTFCWEPHLLHAPVLVNSNPKVVSTLMVKMGFFLGSLHLRSNEEPIKNCWFD